MKNINFILKSEGKEIHVIVRSYLSSDCDSNAAYTNNFALHATNSSIYNDAAVNNISFEKSNYMSISLPIPGFGYHVIHFSVINNDYFVVRKKSRAQ